VYNLLRGREIVGGCGYFAGMRVNDEHLLRGPGTVGLGPISPGGGCVPDRSVVQLEEMVEALGRLASAPVEQRVDDAVRVERIAALERLSGAVAAAQAAQIAQFADSQVAEQRRAGIPARRVGVGVAEQVGFACKLSPVTAACRVGFARTLTADLPHTFGLLTRGQISGWVATLVVRETRELTGPDRRLVDQRLAEALASMSPRQAEAAARRAAITVDPASAVRRGRTARSDRRVSIRPAPDTMALLSGFVPCEQGVAAWAALDRDARARRAAGDPRSRGQIMADTFIERLTGQATATAVPVEIGLTMTTDALLGVAARDDANGTDGAGGAAGSDVATLPGYGPIPAAFARDLAKIGTDGAAAGDACDATEGSGVRPTHDVGNAGVRNIGVRNAGVGSSDVGCGGVADRAQVFIRRILTDPIDQTVVAVDTRRRRFDGPLARYLMARDQHCRMPYCTAPIRHLDHIVPHRAGGPTTAANGQGLCERHSYVKETPGWHVRVVEPDGPGRSVHSTIITTPTGHTYRSQAPPAHG
jgi:hypothetical protein